MFILIRLSEGGSDDGAASGLCSSPPSNWGGVLSTPLLGILTTVDPLVGSSPRGRVWRSGGQSPRTPDRKRVCSRV